MAAFALIVIMGLGAIYFAIRFRYGDPLAGPERIDYREFEFTSTPSEPKPEYALKIIREEQGKGNYVFGPIESKSNDLVLSIEPKYSSPVTVTPIDTDAQRRTWLARTLQSKELLSMDVPAPWRGSFEVICKGEWSLIIAEKIRVN